MTEEFLSQATSDETTTPSPRVINVTPYSLYFKAALESEFAKEDNISEREFQAIKSKDWEQLEEDSRQKYIDKANELNKPIEISGSTIPDEKDEHAEDLVENRDDLDSLDQPKKRAKRGSSPARSLQPGKRRRRGRPPLNSYKQHKVIIQSDKKPARRGRNRIVLNTAEIKYIDDFIDEIYTAALADRNLNIQKAPAIQKLQLLGKLGKTMVNIKLQRLLLKKNILVRMCEWLSPLPDGSLVGNEIRREIISLLGALPIKTSHLIDCEKQYRAEYKSRLEEDNILYDNMTGGIGKVLLLLWRREDENEENRKELEKLIERWYRNIGNSKDDYDIAEFEEIEAELNADERMEKEYNEDEGSQNEEPREDF